MPYQPKDKPAKSAEKKPAPKAKADAEPKFESTIPWESALELVNLVRTGNIKDNRIRAIQLGAWVAGCTATVIGERTGDDQDVVLSNIQPKVADAQAFNLENLCNQVEERATGVSAQGLELTELLALIMQIIRLISELKG